MKNEKCETTYENYFDDNDKKDAFDQIAALFYDKNFGSASKSDVELLMFNLYMEAIINYGYNIIDVLEEFKNKLSKEIEKQTAMSALRVELLAKGIHMPEDK